jgi:hypothetical protein
MCAAEEISEREGQHENSDEALRDRTPEKEKDWQEAYA